MAGAAARKRTMSKSPRLIFGAFIVGLVPSFMLATPLSVASYSMPNGGTGSYVYQDINYSNCPASDCTTTGAALSGGTGRLTNGVIPTTDWNVGSNSAGWIGWESGETNGANPAVTFNFAGPSTINSISIWYDNSLGTGGVTEPASASIDGSNYAFAPNTVEGPQNVTLSGLNISGGSVSVQFFQGADEWIMIGQVSFNGTSGTSAVPEPGTDCLIGGLLAGMLALKGRRLRR